MIKVEPKDPTNPEQIKAAELVTKILNAKVQREVVRQLFHGLPPSEGMPDVRFPLVRWQPRGKP